MQDGAVTSAAVLVPAGEEGELGRAPAAAGSGGRGISRILAKLGSAEAMLTLLVAAITHREPCSESCGSHRPA